MARRAEQSTRWSADGRWPVENSPILYDVAVYQVRSARAGAPWRALLGVEEPSSNLAEAIESVAREIRTALAATSAPYPEAVLTGVRDERPGERELDALARRVLRAMLAARGDRIAIDQPTRQT
jgi:hypothetical protein